MLHAVIMAGGSGTRFWPQSRNETPKQLLQLIGSRSMLQSTVDRLGDLVPPERTLIVTNERLVPAIQQQLPQLPLEALLGEPAKRDTAPAIGLAAFAIARHDPEGVMAVMPSDHVISPDDAFCAALELAQRLVEESPERICTFGIRPSYPAESFGYIERGDRFEAPWHPATAKPPVFHVKQFREKPKAEVARGYLEAGAFYWNSGIFVWKARTILDALQERQPEMYERLSTIAAAMGTAKFVPVLRQEFTAIKGVSIDYAVMEHARDVLVVEAPFNWDDVGSWQAIARLQEADEHGNAIGGRHIGISTKGSIVRGLDEHLIVTLGVTDLIIVHTPDATLVANKHDEESIRELVRLIEKNGWEKYL